MLETVTSQLHHGIIIVVVRVVSTRAVAVVVAIMTTNRTTQMRGGKGGSGIVAIKFSAEKIVTGIAGSTAIVPAGNWNYRRYTKSYARCNDRGSNTNLGLEFYDSINIVPKKYWTV